MTGLKMTTMTIEDMRSDREKGKSKTDLPLLYENKKSGVEPEYDEDSPDATTLMRSAIVQRRAGRPTGTGNKEQVAIRFDKDVLDAFRATGRGWQTRMNDALKAWLKEHAPG
jgi:uncharacterized protein (DUF4415 family)